MICASWSLPRRALRFGVRPMSASVVGSVRLASRFSRVTGVAHVVALVFAFTIRRLFQMLDPCPGLGRHVGAGGAGLGAGYDPAAAHCRRGSDARGAPGQAQEEGP